MQSNDPRISNAAGEGGEMESNAEVVQDRPGAGLDQERVIEQPSQREAGEPSGTTETAGQ